MLPLTVGRAVLFGAALLALGLPASHAGPPAPDRPGSKARRPQADPRPGPKARGPVETGVFGLRLGVSAEAARDSLAPTGTLDGARWLVSPPDAHGVARQRFECLVSAGCFAIPSVVELLVVGDQAVAATLTAEAEQGAADTSSAAQMVAVGRALGPPDASSHAVGRHVRYFLRDGWTIVWTQDGADATVRVALDAADPVPRAEAVAAGAKAKLDALPGAAAYAAGHRAISERTWDEAIRQLDAAHDAPGAATLLRAQTRLVLAMALAARAKGGGGRDPTADLERARVLAPELGEDLDALARDLAKRSPQHGPHDGKP